MTTLVPNYQAWERQQEAAAKDAETHGYTWLAADIRTHITPAVYEATRNGWGWTR